MADETQTKRRAAYEIAQTAASIDPASLDSLFSKLDSGYRNFAGTGLPSKFGRHPRSGLPDLIKLDRDVIAGIDADPGPGPGAAMVGFAREVEAVLATEGIETEAEFTLVIELGMTSGQGYLLGRPSVRPEDWAKWHQTPPLQAKTSTNQQAAD